MKTTIGSPVWKGNKASNRITSASLSKLTIKANVSLVPKL